MPAFLTHFLFGQKVLETLADTRAALAAENEPDAFSWGLQGPDVLFFSKKASVKSAGRLLHEKNAGSFFFEGKRLLDGCSGWKKSVGESFLLGFLCHYYLDSRAHPFVFYFQANNRGNFPKNYFPYLHHRLESDIDSLLYLWKTGQNKNAFCPSETFSTDRELIFILSEILSDLSEKSVPLEIPPADAAESYRKAASLYPVFLDRGGIFYPALRALEILPGTRSFPSAYLRRQKISGDPLNFKNVPYRENYRKNHFARLDFPKLFGRAADECALGILQYFDFLLGKNALDVDFSLPYDNGKEEIL